jgi:hypothetical protein
LELFYPRDHRCFAPPANIQHPSGIGSCDDRNSNSAVTISRKTKATNYTNRHESHEALAPSNPSRFVTGADGVGNTEGKSRNGKRQVSREGSEFQIYVSVLKNLKKRLATFSFIR